VVARTVGFDPDDAGADAAALDQMDGVLRALGWRPARTDGPQYERG
jgi:hypothetical protein